MLRIHVGPGDPRPIFRQIVDAVRLQVARGELEPGARLPSVRALAGRLRVNANTVAKAYGELTAEGLIESRKGVGVFVAVPRQRWSVEERERRLNEALAGFVGAVATLGFRPRDVADRVQRALGGDHEGTDGSDAAGEEGTEG